MNLQKLTTEMYKVMTTLPPIPMQDIFNKHVNTLDLRNTRCLEIMNARTVHYGTESIRYRGYRGFMVI